MQYTGKETVKDALKSQDIFPGYDALEESMKQLANSGYKMPAKEMIDLPLTTSYTFDFHSDIPAKSELCVAVYVEKMKDAGIRAKYPTSLRAAEKRIDEELSNLPPDASPSYRKDLADCKDFFAKRQEVLEGYLNSVIDELYAGATDEYLEEMDPEVFRVEKGSPAWKTEFSLSSALSELLEAAEDFYIKELPDHIGMTKEDARHFGFAVEEDPPAKERKPRSR